MIASQHSAPHADAKIKIESQIVARVDLTVRHPKPPVP
jgi:hypothetical protein